MQKKWLWAGILSSIALTSCAPKNQSENTFAFGKNNVGIIGGRELLEGEILQKYTVAVYDASTDQLCTGVLISHNLVLTAAHCVSHNPSEMHILFGSTVTWEGHRLPVDKLEVSPYWSTNRYDSDDWGDLAILHFIGKAPEGSVPASILTNTRLLKNNAEVVVVGYGVSNEKELTGQGVARTAAVKISNTLYSKSEASLNQVDGRGACHGDSGGPVFIKTSKGYALWGITSRATKVTALGCTQDSVVTRLSSHRAWVTRMSDKLSKSLTDPLDIFQFKSLEK